MTVTASKNPLSCCDTSQKCSHSRRQCRRGKALSAVAWSTMVLVSPALGLTATRTPAHSRVTWKSTSARTETCTRTGRRVMSRGKSELRYRDGDHEDSNTRRLEHAVAASHVRLPGVPSKALKRWFGAVVSPNEESRTPLPSSSCKDSREQFRLDDYLEFVDKRYHRLHDDDDAQSDGGRQGINTAWNWLMKQKPSSDLEAQKGKDDALCVLGLAELASAELLQKHHLPVPKSDAFRRSYEVTTEVVIDAHAQETYEERVDPVSSPVVIIKEKNLPTNGRVASLSAGLSVLHRLHERQAAIASLQLRAALSYSLRATGRSFTSSFKSLVRAIPALIAMGGGAKTLKHTAAVVAAAVLMVLRPITRVAMEA